MLFILHNNVALSFFLRAFCTVFCILYTYFLHISYTFYTYFSHFIHFFLLFFINYRTFMAKNNALPCVFNTFPCVFNTFLCVFPSISYNFLYICTNIARISLHICTALRLASFFIFCTFVQTFSTHCTKLHLRSAIACTNFLARLHKLFPACRRTFSSL